MQSQHSWVMQNTRSPLTSPSMLHQVIHFHRKHHDAIIRGEKVTTVRWEEVIEVGSSLFVFDEHPTAPALEGQVPPSRRTGSPNFLPKPHGSHRQPA